MSKRPSYSDQFKSDAVDLVITQGYRISEAARNLGISASALRCWVRDHQPDTLKAAALPEDLVTAQAKNKVLKKQLKRVEMERDILRVPFRVKKATVSSTGHSNTLLKFISWGMKPQGFTWSLIEPQCHFI